MPSSPIPESPTKRRGGIYLPSLRTIRQAAMRDGVKLTRAKMAKDLGLDYSFLWRIEKGESRAGAETSLAISEYLKVPLDELRQPLAVEA